MMPPSSRSEQSQPNLSLPERAPWLVSWLLRRLQSSPLTRLHLSWRGQHWQLGHIQAGVVVPHVHLHSQKAVWRVLQGGVLGWAEAYMQQEWDSEDLLQLTDWAMHNEQALEQIFQGNRLSRSLSRLLHLFNANTKRGSRRNIAYHYDLGNDFYQHWLDSSMTYSSARYVQAEMSLEQAQQAKYQQILQLLEPHPGQRVLEIGCGWGGMGEHLLTRYPSSIWHGVTLSEEQLAYCQQRLQVFEQQAQASLTDYRDVQGQYQRIVSIEMFEAVGEENWPRYFAKLKQLLAADGVAVLQVITIDERRFPRYRRGCDFIQRYIFPGGMLPSHQRMQEEINRAGLQLSHTEAFGQDYASTLAAWHQRFDQAWQQIESLGFDERFRRMWKYYLAYCESGFKHGSINVRFYQLRHRQP